MTREEAIKTVRNIYQTDAEKEALETLIPELKESEDERIRKALIEALKTSETVGELKFILPEPMREDAIAYLERQKHSLNFDAVSSWLRDHASRYVNGEYNEFHHCIEYDGTINVERLIADLKVAVDSGAFDIHEQKEQKIKWSEEDERMLSRCIKSVECSKQFADSEIYKAAKDVEMNWLKSLPERFNLEPKQEWSEEDEDFINMLILHFNYLINKGGDSVETYKSYIEKLKSFCPPKYCENCKLKRSVENWRPSEEQMRALKVVVDQHWDVDGDALYSLYIELKEL